LPLQTSYTSSLIVNRFLTLIQADKYPVNHQVFFASAGIYGLIF